MRVSIVVLIALLFSFLHALLLFELFFYVCKEAVSLAPLHTFSMSLGKMSVSIWCLLMWWNSNNRCRTIFYQYYWKISNCIFYTHTQKLHKMRVLFMSDRFCICAVTIAVASRHFMLFSLIIIYHLIVPKCFLQSDNFINNPFPLSLFFCTVAYKSIKILAAISDKLQ